MTLIHPDIERGVEEYRAEIGIDTFSREKIFE
jgi:hypothetical protein